MFAYPVREEKEATDSVFRRLDTECNGRLTRSEIRLAFRIFLGTDLNDQEVDDIFTRVRNSLDHLSYLVNPS